MVRWHLGGREIDSYFRIVDGSPDEFVSAVGTIGKGTL
jgi:hypothetical protein